MNMPGRQTVFRWAAPPLLVTGIAVAIACAPNAKAVGQQPKAEKPPLDQEVTRLREKVAALEAALADRRPADAQASGSMSMGEDGEGMGPMAGTPADRGNLVAARYRDCLSCHRSRPTGPLPASHLAPSAGMGPGMTGGMGPSGGMGMPDDELMGMGAMGRAGGGAMGPMKMESDLPGFPGASHLYHVGASGFFLDHGAHITLSAEQRRELNGLREEAFLGGSSCARKVDEAEQELWELTASDTPEASAIEAKVREIESLRGDRRLAFIRAVGEAAEVLTAEQRNALVGAAASDSPAHGPP